MSIEQEILEKIKKFDKIIIHRHQRPDPDAYGSQCGLATILRDNFPGKKFIKLEKVLRGYLGFQNQKKLKMRYMVMH